MRLAQGDSAVEPRRRSAIFRTGPFLVALQSDDTRALELRDDLYPDTQQDGDGQIIDFHIRLRRPRSHRRWLRPFVLFDLDNLTPFDPYPLNHAFPLLEWGLNWCIATQAHQYLMLHAAVVELDGKALIMPALPGSGKSTLSAALAHRGWRLLSDEFGLISPADGRVSPLPRAIPLKNQSIEVIRRFEPNAWLGPLFPKTRKGTVAHMRPPADSLVRQTDPADPAWILFPRYKAGQTPRLTPLRKSPAFTRIAHNSFNYRLLGADGFRTLTALVSSCACFSLEYGDLDEAIDTIAKMVVEAN